MAISGLCGLHMGMGGRLVHTIGTPRVGCGGATMSRSVANGMSYVLRRGSGDFTDPSWAWPSQ
jgi:hypothetical protein